AAAASAPEIGRNTSARGTSARGTSARGTSARGASPWGTTVRGNSSCVEGCEAAGCAALGSERQGFGRRDRVKQKRPGSLRGVRQINRQPALGSLCVKHLGAAIADRDLARLVGLGDLARQVDMQQAVLEMSALDLHMVGQLERPLEGARRNALIEHVALLLVGL